MHEMPFECKLAFFQFFVRHSMFAVVVISHCISCISSLFLLLMRIMCSFTFRTAGNLWIKSSLEYVYVSLGRSETRTSHKKWNAHKLKYYLYSSIGKKNVLLNLFYCRWIYIQILPVIFFSMCRYNGNFLLRSLPRLWLFFMPTVLPFTSNSIRTYSIVFLPYVCRNYFMGLTPHNEERKKEKNRLSAFKYLLMENGIVGQCRAIQYRYCYAYKFLGFFICDFHIRFYP